MGTRLRMPMREKAKQAKRKSSEIFGSKGCVKGGRSKIWQMPQ